jgi:hypothetical protein
MDDRKTLHKLATDVKRITYIEERIMGMQSEADETPYWDGDFAFLRDDEIYCLGRDFLSTITDANNTLPLVNDRLDDEHWPIRILFSFISHMLSNPDLDFDSVYPSWFDKYRENDEDPTYPR